MRRIMIAMLMTGFLLGSGAAVSAQGATPEATTPAGTGDTIEVLFIQSASASELTPVEENALGATHELKLTGHIDPVISFGDHPSHEVGTIQAGDLLATIDADLDDPPNAALVARTTDGAEEIIVVEILSGAGDTEGNIVYMVRPLADYSELELGLASEPVSDLTEPRSYQATHLFIDDWCFDPEFGVYFSC